MMFAAKKNIVIIDYRYTGKNFWLFICSIIGLGFAIYMNFVGYDCPKWMAYLGILGYLLFIIGHFPFINARSFVELQPSCFYVHFLDSPKHEFKYGTLKSVKLEGNKLVFTKQNGGYINFLTGDIPISKLEKMIESLKKKKIIKSQSDVKG